ncbi:putative Xaa-Pro aminopeptidase P [Nosema granulosis]|uniref:Xaa-Pro aminopeptidase P n=1 Tax=Nosema granulosis TaxID=83296 RepID=A0A9P6KYB0_9MICR|nr:putative Xaa-Pro aminopeptidase P [Nosema granulosis]
MEDLMKKHNIGAYITRTGDEHLSEYIGDSDKRVKFLTGFTGSNGIAVTCKDSVLYTDSRYYIQAERELKGYKLMRSTDTPIEEYLSNTLENRRVGLCPRFFSGRYYKIIKEKFAKKGLELVSFKNDLVDEIWKDKPERIFKEIYSIENFSLEDFYSKNLGEENLFKDTPITKSIPKRVVSMNYKEKLEKVRNLIGDDETLIISELDTIAWLLNLRGDDIEYNPIFYSYLVITKRMCHLFVNSKIALEDVKIHNYCDFCASFIDVITNKVVFSGDCNAFITNKFPTHRTIEDIRMLQSIKGEAEIEGFNLAYILDGIALTRLFEYVESNYKSLDEKTVADKLNEFKSIFAGYNGPSFGTIAGAGENSAVVHYEAGDKQLENDMPLLVDSGSNYTFGTTDTTRTLFIGKPSDEFRKDFTLVLKGQLRAMCGTFPVGVSGGILDGLTRLDLWKQKRNYGHAAGHGVGHFLCVHENPPTLYPNSSDAVKPSQIFSIEPGFYKDGEYGIRIENLVLSQDVGDGFMQFKNITYVPYQLDLIDLEMLTDEELDQINSLSREIRRVLERYIEKGSRVHEYLIKNTKELKK